MYQLERRQTSPKNLTRFSASGPGSGLRRREMNHAVVLLVDLKGTGLHLHADVILFRPLGWHSPRVPAGETSAILEIALLHHFARRGR